MSDNCKEVDLEIVSITSNLDTVKAGEKVLVTVKVRNNGPCTIPRTEATCQLTISAKHFVKPTKFKNLNKKQWSLLGIKTDKDYHNMFLQSRGSALEPNEQDQGFTFELKGKKSTESATSSITIASSLSATSTVGDIDGTNQSKLLGIKVLPKEKK